MELNISQLYKTYQEQRDGMTDEVHDAIFGEKGQELESSKGSEIPDGFITEIINAGNQALEDTALQDLRFKTIEDPF